MKSLARISAFFLFFLFCNSSFAKNTLLINFTHDGLTVNGRLQIPNGNGPYQVIVIAPGSGPNDKDGTLPMYGTNVSCLYSNLYGDTLRPYMGLSNALSDSGYAVLTYDKIEYTHPNPAPITFHKLWLPVESAIKYLKTRNDVDTNNIILLGHSEGASMIPYIARNEASVRALISLAGPRRPLDSLLAYQLKFIAKTCNGDTNLANNQSNQILQYFNDIRTGNWSGSTPALFGVSAAVWSDYIKVIDSVSINYNLANRQTLFIGLGDDINVPPSVELARFQNEITLGSDFYNLPGINHYLTSATDPATVEVLTDTIIFWLRKHVFPVSVSTIANEENMIAIYPCPADDFVVFACNEHMKNNLKLTVINSVGNIIKEVIINKNKGSYNWDTHATPSGMYSFTLLDGDKLIHVGKVIIAH